jgi:hypothetical protein
MPVPWEIFNIDEGSLLKLPVRPGDICDHTFLVLLDYQFAIRDYEIPGPNTNIEQYIQKSDAAAQRFDFEYF